MPSGVFLDAEPPKHHCALPYYAEDWPENFADRAAVWECLTCGQIYTISYTGWTGWWSLDFRTDAHEVKDKYGHPTIICPWEEWVDCVPSIVFTPRRPNNLGLSAIHITDPRPGPRPEWLPSLPQPLRPSRPRHTLTELKEKDEPTPRKGFWKSLISGTTT